ncbi:MAG: right-handed parallel beta-helix repeat-containing protein [Planctomycetia bacterium]|nr:right-handed parallel beta-helix repeat-containing protein [Planctomycetia bacterium]
MRERFGLGLLFCIVTTTLCVAQWAEPEKVAAVERGECTEARVSWWGFDPEDSTRFLQAAIHSGVKKLRVDRQASDWITGPLMGASNLEIVLDDDVTLMAKKGDFKRSIDSLLTFSLCENVTIRGGKNSVLRMRKADYHTDAYTQAEWRHGLNLKSSRNVRVEDLTIEYTGGDGIYLGVSKRGVPCENIVIRRVVCNENNRQGISVISARNLLIEDTILKNTNGTAPQAGIDFEPNGDSEELVNCVMRNCVCENNAGDAYLLYLPNLKAHSAPVSLRFENCVSRNNRRRGFSLMTFHSRKDKTSGPLQGTIAVKNFVSENDASGGILLRENRLDGVKLTFENTRLEVPGDAAPILFQTEATASDLNPVAVGNTSFGKVRITQTHDVPFLQFRDASAMGLGLQQVSGTFQLDGAGPQRTEEVNDAWLAAHYPALNTRKLPILAIPTEYVPQKAVSEEKSLAWCRLRHTANFAFYASRGESVRMTLRSVPIGKKPGGEIGLSLEAPSGKKVSIPTLEYGGEVEIHFTAEESGLYQFGSQNGPGAFCVVKTNIPVQIPATPARFIHTIGTLAVPVPEGTPDFAIKLWGYDQERVGIVIFDPSGKEVFRNDAVDRLEYFYPRTPTPGVWRIQCSQPGQGVLEDFGIALEGVVPLLVP